MSEQEAPVAPTAVPVPTTMRAVVQDGYGTADVLELREVPVPEPGPDEVLVRVAASSVNAGDWHTMLGLPHIARPAFLGLRRPKERIQGRDVVGRVVALGSGVTTFAVGDEVFGRPGSQPLSGGGFAEYVSAAAAQLAHRPPELSVEQAACLPLAGSTALEALRDVGEVRPGQRVLVNGASGGVGSFAVQIAKILGAEVTAVCSTRNLAMAESLGADHVVDYRRQDFTRLGSRYDVVLDSVATRSLAALRRAVAPEGTLVLTGGGAGRWIAPIPLILSAGLTAPFVSQRLRPSGVTPDRANHAQLAAWAVEGRLTAVVDRVYPLAETADAMRYVVEEHARGKVVIAA